MDFGTNPYLIAYAITPLASAFFHRKVKNVWLILVLIFVYALADWLLLFAELSWIDDQWEIFFEKTPNPSSELLELSNQDGASRAFTLFFGLPISLVYVFVVWGVFRLFIRIIKKIKSGPNPSINRDG